MNSVKLNQQHQLSSNNNNNQILNKSTPLQERQN